MAQLPPLPSNAFSGAAVKLDNSAVDRFLLQNTYAKNQARDLALTKYFGTLSNRLTPAGMDTEKDESGHSDMEDFIDKKNAWQDFYLQNRRAINNPSMDRGQAAMQADRLYNDAMGIAQRSKEKVKNLAQLKPILDDPNKRALLPQQTLDDIHSAQLGINNPNYKPIDFSHISYNPKPWSTQDETGLSNEVNKYKATPQTPTISQNPATGMQTVTTENKFDSNALQGIYSAGSGAYERHPGFKSMIDGIIKEQGPTYQNLKQIYKDKYGVDATHPEDIAAAYAIGRHAGTPPVIKENPIPGYSDIAQQKKLQVAGVQSNITLEREKKLSDYNRQKKDEDAAAKTGDSEGYLQGIEDRATKGGALTRTIGDKTVTEYPVELTPKLVSLFSVNDKGHKIDPDRIHYDADHKTYTGVWFEKDKDTGKPSGEGGNYAVSQQYPPKTLSRESVKVGLNEAFLPKKQAGAALPQPTQQPKTTSAEDIKKKFGIHY